jgi:hypothetical protein
VTPSARLYAVATEAEHAALRLAHAPDGENPRRCARSCPRCRLEARARLYGRCGDSAQTLEKRQET